MNKYVIVKDTKENKVYMRFANTDFHYMLVMNGERCLGGGMFNFDEEKNEMKLFGRSSDFGAPNFDEIKEKIHTDEDLEGMRIIFGGAYPSLEEQREDITEKFIFDEW